LKDKEQRRALMQALCLKMIHRIDALGISATTDGEFVSEFDGKYFTMQKNHLRCVLKADFKDAEHGLDTRDFREVVDRTIQSLLDVVREEGAKSYSSLVREILVS